MQTVYAPIQGEETGDTTSQSREGTPRSVGEGEDTCTDNDLDVPWVNDSRGHDGMGAAAGGKLKTAKSTRGSIGESMSRRPGSNNSSRGNRGSSSSSGGSNSSSNNSSPDGGTAGGGAAGVPDSAKRRLSSWCATKISQTRTKGGNRGRSRVGFWFVLISAKTGGVVGAGDGSS